jgi:hypothetical protein
MVDKERVEWTILRVDHYSTVRLSTTPVTQEIADLLLLMCCRVFRGFRAASYEGLMSHHSVEYIGKLRKGMMLNRATQLLEQLQWSALPRFNALMAA